MPSKAEVIAAFKVVDTDGDGAISVAELKAILTRPVRGQAATLTDSQVEDLVKEFDKNKDGVPSTEEFAEAFASITGDKAHASLEQMMQLVAAPPGETYFGLGRQLSQR